MRARHVAHEPDSLHRARPQLDHAERMELLDRLSQPYLRDRAAAEAQHDIPRPRGHERHGDRRRECVHHVRLGTRAASRGVDGADSCRRPVGGREERYGGFRDVDFLCVSGRSGRFQWRTPGFEAFGS